MKEFFTTRARTTQEIFEGLNGTTDTITFNFSTLTQNYAIMVEEFAGLAPSNVADVSAANTGSNAATLDSGTTPSTFHLPIG